MGASQCACARQGKNRPGGDRDKVVAKAKFEVLFGHLVDQKRKRRELCGEHAPLSPTTMRGGNRASTLIRSDEHGFRVERPRNG
jgi:hypothetical protein